MTEAHETRNQTDDFEVASIGLAELNEAAAARPSPRPRRPRSTWSLMAFR